MSRSKPLVRVLENPFKNQFTFFSFVPKRIVTFYYYGDHLLLFLVIIYLILVTSKCTSNVYTDSFPNYKLNNNDQPLKQKFVLYFFLTERISCLMSMTFRQNSLQSSNNNKTEREREKDRWIQSSKSHHFLSVSQKKKKKCTAKPYASSSSSSPSLLPTQSTWEPSIQDLTSPSSSLNPVKPLPVIPPDGLSVSSCTISLESLMWR